MRSVLKVLKIGHYCTWYVIPDVTAPNQPNTLSKSHLTSLPVAVNPTTGIDGSVTMNYFILMEEV